MDQARPQGKDTPSVSVLISAKNERANLIKYLKKILDQEYHDFEVIVISDHSTDGTDTLLLEWAQQNDTLKVIINHDEEQGKKASLTKGVLQAKGEWLLFTDADCCPNSNQWIAHMVSRIDTGCEIVIGVGPTYLTDSFISKWVAFENMYVMVQYLSMTMLGSPYMAVGRNLMYKRSLFDWVGGYSAHRDILSGDDDLFIRDAATKRNVRLAFSSNTFMFSDPPSSVLSYLHQRKRHISTSHFYKNKVKFVLMLNHISHLSVILSLILIGFNVGLFYGLFILILVRIIPLILIYSKLQNTIYPKRSSFHFIIFDTIIPVVYLFFVFYIKKKESIIWK